jgi:phage tail sheath protein FI
MPVVGSGSLNGAFGGAVGSTIQSAAMNLFENIPVADSVATSPTTNIQGVFKSDYAVAIGLLGNKDQYDFKTISAPGLTVQNASSKVSDLLSLSQTRGTSISVVDMTSYAQNISTATQQAITLDSSYGATYWPWVQLRSQETGKLFFCPASTIVPAVYEYSDKISAEWFAPAGLTRGGLTTVIQPERRLTVGQRDTLYASKVNPIAIFPGQGTVIYGQKTLQAKPTALDRVGVRRLLIALKRYIGNIAEGLVFVITS